MRNQLNFFMTEKDESQLLSLPMLGNVKFLYPVGSIPMIQEYREFNLLPRIKTRNNLVYICIEHDIDRIVFEISAEDNQFHIDPLKSPVIEFLRSGLHPMGVLVMGYFRYRLSRKSSDSEYFSPGEVEPLFELFGEITSWIKSNYKEIEFDKYIGLDAFDCLSEGISLSR